MKESCPCECTLKVWSAGSCNLSGMAWIALAFWTWEPCCNRGRNW